MSDLAFGDWDTPSARAIKEIPPLDAYGGDNLTLLQLDYHRNGVGGAGFYTGFFQLEADEDEENGTYMFTTFNQGGDETAVVNYDDIEKEHRDGQSVWGVQFVYNSYRGADYYGPAIRTFIADERFLTNLERDGLVKTFYWSELEKEWAKGPEDEKDPTPDLIESRLFQKYVDDNPREYAKAVESAASEIEGIAKRHAEAEAEKLALHAENRAIWDAEYRRKAFLLVDHMAGVEILKPYMKEDFPLRVIVDEIIEAALKISEAREILGEDFDRE